MNDPIARHLVAVWDPSRPPDTMEATVRHLLALAQARAGESVDELDDVFVWWGKMRSPNRQQPLPHLPELLALDGWIRGESTSGADAPATLADDREVQLYLTDYRSLYVAHVGEITTDDPRHDVDAGPHLPPGVYPDGVHCDAWFMLFDVRRLVLDDTRAVVAELRKLRNARYADRPVSIYGGMVDLPLLVRREDGATWFDTATRDRLTDGRLWVEFDAEHAGVGAVAASLRDDVLGEATWMALDPAARLFVATAEKIFRDHRADPAFDFSPVVVNLAKAYEVQLALTLAPAVRRLPPAARLVNVDGRSVDVFGGEAFGLGGLARALGESQELRGALPRVLAHAAWALTTLPPVLDELSRLRNPGAHREPIDRETARRVRDRQLGIGGGALLEALARVRPL